MAQWTVQDPQRIELDGEVDRIDVSLVTGKISIVGVPGAARLEIKSTGKKPVNVEHDSGRLKIHHEARKHWPVYWWLFHRRYYCEITVAVPPEAIASVTVVSGRVSVAGLRTTTDVDVTSGRVSLLGLAGRTRAKLVSGPVEALGVAGELVMETVSGSLTVAQSGADRVQATTTSGSITCDLDSTTPADVRLNTTSGSITIRIPAEADLDVRLDTTAGSITTVFPLDRQGVHWSGSAHGRLGNGSGRLSATTTSGSIALLAGE
ncbi:MAG: DUF4097 family beta strand repeat protein [Hamadaea sp.]|uniref:DUF4097 family beta strand repeat-containing protein n=1 Tax=Hamadaea sp. TaxID=2024425 RepID=UPI0017A70CD6|nr:DUF4097 family beta strand repeat-containing protein [Hamadaea sp.]NUR74055.1 DUF4097 family beta strand repeat protein [Hamadaea sp.]NUT22658.1 DUF4097 family beta strand repeat protein [Hamadaea sp.]